MTRPALPKLLLIGAKFFGYDQAILRNLQARGYDVDLVSDCPPARLTFKVVKKLAPPLARRLSEAHFLPVLQAQPMNDYARIFVLKGEALTRRAVQMLRQRHPQAPATLYLWDSLLNMPFGDESVDLYDRVFSFDPHDTQHHSHIQLQPLFFFG